jgi:hypothetical protein
MSSNKDIRNTARNLTSFSTRDSRVGGALSGQYIHRKTMVTNNNGDVCSVLSSLPPCMVTLNISNLHPIACNEMFVRVIGPLTKFADEDFVKTACSDDKQHAESRGRIQSAWPTTLCRRPLTSAMQSARSGRSQLALLLSRVGRLRVRCTDRPT